MTEAGVLVSGTHGCGFQESQAVVDLLLEEHAIHKGLCAFAVFLRLGAGTKHKNDDRGSDALDLVAEPPSKGTGIVENLTRQTHGRRSYALFPHRGGEIPRRRRGLCGSR